MGENSTKRCQRLNVRDTAGKAITGMAIVIAAFSTAHAGGVSFKPDQLVSVGKNEQMEAFAIRDTRFNNDTGVTSFDALLVYTERGRKEVFPDLKKKPDAAIVSFEVQCGETAHQAKAVYYQHFLKKKKISEKRIGGATFQYFDSDSVTGKLAKVACSPEFE